MTVGTILIPQAMAYGTLAGVPPIYGLYASVVPIIIYGLFASSTKLAIGPVAVSALLIFAGISQLAKPESPEFIQYVILTGLLVGIFQTLLGIFKLGSLVNFISHPVIAGFTSAAAVIIVITQLKDALGLNIQNSSDSLETLGSVFSNIGSTNYLSLALCIGTIFLIFVFKKISANIPGPLILVILSIILSKLLSLNDLGVSIIKDIPSGFPSLTIPIVSMETIMKLMPTVIAVTMIGIVESIGIAKALEAKHKDHIINPNQELIALGLAKIGGSFFQAIPSSGSFSRSAINSNQNAKSQISNFISVILIVITLFFLTDFFYYLPKAVLAAIILLSVVSLFDIKEAKHLWKINRSDLALMAITFFATLVLGIEYGVLLGVMLSLFLVLYKSSHPNIVQLGRIEGTRYYKDLHRFQESKNLPNILIIRFEDQLYFGNAAYFKENILSLIEKHHEKIHNVILKGTGINAIDSTGMHVLEDLDIELQSKGIQLHLCGMIGSVRDQLFVAGLLKEKGKHHLHVHDAVTFISEGINNENVNGKMDISLQSNQKK